MGLPKGKTNNPEGRPAGTPNRLTTELREALKTSLSGEIEKIPEYLETLEIKDKLDILSKLLPYVLPKYSNIEISGMFETTQKTVIDLKSLTNEELEQRLNIVSKIER